MTSFYLYDDTDYYDQDDTTEANKLQQAWSLIEAA